MIQIQHDQELEGAGGFAKKLLAAQRSAQDIVPTQKHYDGYLYAPVDQVVREMKGCLVSVGLVLQTSVESFEEFETSTRNGQPQWMTTVRLRFHLTDSETGFTRDYSFLGRGLNEKDKGVTHAIQSGKKHFLLSLLLVEVTEDAPPPRENGSGEGEGEGTRSTRSAKRIPEARGIAFTRSDDGDFIRGDTGEIVRSCMSAGVHDRGGAPMLRIPPDGSRWLCIHVDCGHVEAHDRDEGAELEEPSSDDVENDEPPARSGREEVNEAKLVSDLRASVERMVRKNDVYDWQWRAMVLALDFPDDTDAWGPERWQQIHDGLQRSPASFIRDALKKCAKEVPADDQRCEYLRSLYAEADVSFAARAEAEAAIESGWHDAVEGIIQEWEDGKVEAPELALTAGAGSES